MSASYRIAPPFETRGQLISFVGALAVALALPFFNSWVLRASPADVYRSVPPRYVNYRFMGDRIAAGGDVDLLFVGASDAWTAFDTGVLTEELSAALGRPAVVLNFGANFYGAEATYARVSDALSNLHVKVVVLADTNAGYYYPHELTKYWWRFPEADPPTSLTLRQRLTLFAASVLGAPHRTWADLRGVSNLKLTPSWQSTADTMDKTLGFNGERVGWLSNFDPDRTGRRPYAEIDLPLPQIPVDEMFFRNREDEHFANSFGYNAYQTAFLKKMDQRVHAQGGIFAMISTPDHFRDRPQERVLVRPLFNNEAPPWPHIGVAMTALFQGMSFDEMKVFYSNESHLNASGARRFSHVLTPAFAKLVIDAETP